MNLQTISGTSTTPIDNGIGCSTSVYSTGFLINQTTINKMKQSMKSSKVAVFKVTRNNDTNEITEAEFVKELWVTVKPGVSMELMVAKELKDYDPETTVIKEMLWISW